VNRVQLPDVVRCQDPNGCRRTLQCIDGQCHYPRAMRVQDAPKPRESK
jgi:hypothetical protein